MLIFTLVLWNGLVIVPENRCSPYDREDYSYPQSVELEIIARDGLTSPYLDEVFASRDLTDIDHVVALSEAHDSGLCAEPDSVRKAFARDVLNLVLSSPQLNRFEKRDKDAAEWIPEKNQCWFAETVVSVKQKYSLTVDEAEKFALESILATCGPTANAETSWARWSYSDLVGTLSLDEKELPMPKSSILLPTEFRQQVIELVRITPSFNRRRTFSLFCRRAKMTVNCILLVANVSALATYVLELERRSPFQSGSICGRRSKLAC